MIKNLSLYFVYLFCLSTIAQKNSAVNSFSQTEKTTPETIYAHLNAVTFVTGETLLFKIYCLNPSSLKTSTISKVVYVKIVNDENKIFVEQKIFLKNGIASGTIFIPSNLKTSQYKFIAYTKWMLNNLENSFFENDILIINPFQTLDAIQSIDPISNRNINNIAHSKSLKIILNKKTFTNREQVIVDTNYKNMVTENGNYSISVSKIDSISNQQPTTAIIFATKIKPESIKIGQNILPELRGEQIEGKIITLNDTQPIHNIPVALSIYGKENQFKIVKTDQNGNFTFHINEVYKNPNAVFQILKQNRSEYYLTLKEFEFPELKKLKFKNNLTFDSLQTKRILKKSIASQIQNAYSIINNDSIKTICQNKPFYNNLAIHYNLDDYTRFPTLKETITEIVREMYYSKSKENYTIGIRDYTTERKLSESSLVLVDGLLIQDINELFDWDMNNVQKISIVPGGYYYGGTLLDGIIIFTTKKYDFITKSKGDYFISKQLNMPVPEKKFDTIDYSKKNNNRIPDYRYQLFWQPIFKPENKTTFYTSDIKGNFEIIIEGFSEKGIPISARETFSVE